MQQQEARNDFEQAGQDKTREPFPDKQAVVSCRSAGLRICKDVGHRKTEAGTGHQELPQLLAGDGHALRPHRLKARHRQDRHGLPVRTGTKPDSVRHHLHEGRQDGPKGSRDPDREDEETDSLPEDSYDDTDESDYDDETNEELKDLVIIDEDELELEQ